MKYLNQASVMDFSKLKQPAYRTFTVFVFLTHADKISYDPWISPNKRHRQSF